MNERRLLWGLPGLKFALHMALSPRYGFHGDEYYFIECGRHLDLGYVDHAPLTPWIAALADWAFPDSLVGLRLFAALAGALGVALAILVARALGGSARAQLIAGLCFVMAPAYLRMHTMFNIVAFEPVYWTAASLLLLKLSRSASPRLWMALGLVVGLGLLNKHTMLLWIAGAGPALLSPPLRAQLRTRWPWLATTLALLIVSPNLYWQATHDYATLQFIQHMNEGTLARIPRPLFLAGQLLYMHPLLLPVWLLGLVHLWRTDGGRLRFLAAHYLTVLAILLLTGGKPYYLSASYVVLFAAGAVVLDRWLATLAWVRLRAWLLPLCLLLAMPISMLTLPLLPLSVANANFDRLFGAVISAEELNHDMHNQFGWPEQVESVRRVWLSLDERHRRNATILTGNYGQASAVNVLGRVRGLPRAHTGHMTHHLWGPGPHERGILIAYGLTSGELSRVCRNPRERGRIQHPLAHPKERDVPIFVCEPKAPLAHHWSALKRYWHGARGPESSK